MKVETAPHVSPWAPPFTPTQEELRQEPSGLADLPPFLAADIQHALSGAAAEVGALALDLFSRDDAGVIRWFGGSLQSPAMPSGEWAALFERPTSRPFNLSAEGGHCRCLSLFVPGVAGDIRLGVFGIPARVPSRKLSGLVLTARLCLRIARGARQITRLDGKSNSLTAVTDMLSSVLQADTIEGTLAGLAQSVAETTGSPSVNIDSYDLPARRLHRSSYTEPSWPASQEMTERWKQLLEIRVRETERGEGFGASRLNQWRQPTVVPDLQNPMILDSMPAEEAAFYIEAGLRTVVLVPLWVGPVFVGILSVSNREVRHYTPVELDWIARMADVAAVAIRGAQLMADLGRARDGEQKAHMDNIARLAAAAEARDPTTAHHLERLQYTVRVLARHMMLDERTSEDIAQASRMHDIGKISVPDSILLKPGPLTDSEREVIKRHTIDGERLLGGGVFGVAREVARSHHERWDGDGYPDGLAGEDIPFSARLVSVADVYDALISFRPYKKAWPQDAAVKEIRSCAGSQFDPRVVEVFTEVWRSGGLEQAHNEALIH